MPIVPFNVLNYVAGVSALSLRDYVLATAVGILPGAFAYVALGGSLDDPGSPQFWDRRRLGARTRGRGPACRALAAASR